MRVLFEKRSDLLLSTLRKTIKAAYVTDGSIEEAKALLKQIRTKTPRRSEKVD